MATIREVTSLDDWERMWNGQRDSSAGQILVFKRSPTCPKSLAVEAEFRRFMEDQQESPCLQVVCVDVITSRPVSQKIAADTDVKHESPQALLIGGGQKVVWHASHEAISEDVLAAALG